MDITITPRGTAYILVYNMNWPTIDARIYKASVGDLADGGMGTQLPAISNTAGSSWLVLWDEADTTLWVGAGNEIEARDADGNVVRTFTPADLGDNAYSIALIGTGGDTGGSGGGGGGSSGCDTGFGLFALLAVALVAFTRRRRRG
jgi:Synergist-CTERM protein sorting domain-containing protein